MSYISMDLHVMVEVPVSSTAEQVRHSFRRVSEGREPCVLVGTPSGATFHLILDEVVAP